MAALRLALRLAAMAAVFLPAFLLHGGWRLAGLTSPWPRRFLAAAGWISGARVTVTGTPRRRDAVLLANHLTPLDIPVLAGASGCVFVAKDDLARAPVVGWLASLNRTVFVARADRLGVAAQVAAVRATLAGESPVTIFPEGRIGDGTLGPFKPALLAALDGVSRDTRAQPVLIDYGAATAELIWPEAEPGVAYMCRVLGRAGTLPVRLHFLDPFDPADFPGRKAVAAEARRRMLAALAG